MKWRQFLTPVSSIDCTQAGAIVNEKAPDEVIYLDVRQPGEYATSHLPGAKLIPLGELDHRLDELNREQQIIVY